MALANLKHRPFDIRKPNGRLSSKINN